MYSYYTIKKHNHYTRETNSVCDQNIKLIEHRLNAYEAKQAIVHNAFVFNEFIEARRAIKHLRWNKAHIDANYSVDGLFIPTNRDREYVTGFVCEVAA